LFSEEAKEEKGDKKTLLSFIFVAFFGLIEFGWGDQRRKIFSLVLGSRSFDRWTKLPKG